MSDKILFEMRKDIGIKDGILGWLEDDLARIQLFVNEDLKKKYADNKNETN